MLIWIRWISKYKHKNIQVLNKLILFMIIIKLFWWSFILKTLNRIFELIFHLLHIVLEEIHDYTFYIWILTQFYKLFSWFWIFKIEYRVIWFNFVYCWWIYVFSFLLWNLTSTNELIITYLSIYKKHSFS
jgi:hypothetical protein